MIMAATLVGWIEDVVICLWKLCMSARPSVCPNVNVSSVRLQFRGPAAWYTGFSLIEYVSPGGSTDSANVYVLARGMKADTDLFYF